MKETDLLKRIERLKKELVEKEEMIRERENVIKERENVIREREDELKERDLTLDEKEKEIALLYKSREKRDLGQIKTEREHEMFVCCSKIVNSPTAPKLSTYDGTTEWKPYFIQFNYIAQKYMWNEREKLDKLIECLREKALKFFSSRPENVQSDF